MPANQYPYATMLANVLNEIKDDPVMLAIALKDPVLAQWWAMRQEKEGKRIAAELKKKQAAEENSRLAAIKTDLMNRLTDDEKKALGIGSIETIPLKKRARRVSPKPSRTTTYTVYTIDENSI